MPIDTLVIAFQVFAALLSGGILWKMFGLATHFGRLEQKIIGLEADAKSAKRAEDELDELKRSVAVLSTQIGAVQAQLTSLQTMVMDRIQRPR